MKPAPKTRPDLPLGLLSVGELAEAEALMAALGQPGAQDTKAQRALQALASKCSAELVLDWIQKSYDHSNKFLFDSLLAAIALEQKEILLRDHRPAFKELVMEKFRGNRLGKKPERKQLRRLLSFLGDEARKWMLHSIANQILGRKDHLSAEDQWQAWSFLWSARSDLDDPALPPALLAAALKRPGRYSVEAAVLIWSHYLPGHNLGPLAETMSEDALSRAIRSLHRTKGLNHHRLALALANTLRAKSARRVAGHQPLPQAITARKERLARIRVGEIRRGCSVNGVEEFGLLVELEPGIHGVLHSANMIWGALPTDPPAFEAGQTLDVMVLGVDEAQGSVVVGLKQMIFIQWEDAQTRYSVGAKVKAKVLRAGSKDALVQLDGGIQGLIAGKDLSWDTHDRPADLLRAGEEIEAIVLGVDVANLVFLLSTRLGQIDPWEEVERLYPIGSVAVGKVTNLVEYGAFVRLRPGIYGLLHKDDRCWGRAKHPSSVVSVGQEIEVKVLDIQKERRRIGLTMMEPMM